MNTFVRAFIAWLPLGFAVSVVCLLGYVSVQQNYRQSLNDPQIQVAEDAAAILKGGGAPAQLVVRGAPLTDIGVSLAPWIAVYDSKGKPMESSAKLHGQPPQPPRGLFDTSTWEPRKAYEVNGMKETRVTWESESGVRQALVMVSVGDTFVVAGRNMREVEDREAQLSLFVLSAWMIALIGSLVATLFGAALWRRF